MEPNTAAEVLFEALEREPTGRLPEDALELALFVNGSLHDVLRAHVGDLAETVTERLTHIIVMMSKASSDAPKADAPASDDAEAIDEPSAPLHEPLEVPLEVPTAPPLPPAEPITPPPLSGEESTAAATPSIGTLMASLGEDLGPLSLSPEGALEFPPLELTIEAQIEARFDPFENATLRAPSTAGLVRALIVAGSSTLAERVSLALGSEKVAIVSASDTDTALSGIMLDPHVIVVSSDDGRVVIEGFSVAVHISKPKCLCVAWGDPKNNERVCEELTSLGLRVVALDRQEGVPALLDYFRSQKL